MTSATAGLDHVLARGQREFNILVLRTEVYPPNGGLDVEGAAAGRPWPNSPSGGKANRQERIWA